ncbi:MAG TPA: hypothetical protein ENI77_06235 [Nitrospirae bacterium]|nr:hypothetical protein [Nitrospirota bacterium]
MVDEKTGHNIERELIEAFMAALKKGMTAEEFFAMADSTMEHLRGKAKNETIEKIINDTATPQDVQKMIDSLNK